MNDNNFKSFVNDILLILVVYKTNLKHSLSFNSILKSLDGTDFKLNFLIYDNSPNPIYTGSKTYNNAEIIYIHDKLNSGVSKAYNEGYKIALIRNKKWLLLMDQDTICPKNFLIEFCHSILKYPEISLFVPKLVCNDKILSPCNYFFGRGSAKIQISNGIHDFNKKSLLNSGMLIKNDAFNKAGGYNNKIKLDFSDFYFINNFKKHYNSFVITKAECIHELSSNENNNETIINRFKFYCNGARNYLNFKNFLWISLWCKLRMLKLTLKYKDIRFLIIFFNYFILNKK